jgi:hypothetical protein
MQMLQYNSSDGQSISDICLNTYGTLDLLSKIMTDNNITDINQKIESNTTINWDLDLCVDRLLYDHWKNNNIILSTVE